MSYSHTKEAIELNMEGTHSKFLRECATVINSWSSGILPKHIYTWLKRCISSIHQSYNEILNHLISDVRANDASSECENMAARLQLTLETAHDYQT